MIKSRIDLLGDIRKEVDELDVVEAEDSCEGDFEDFVMKKDVLRIIDRKIKEYSK